MLVLAAVAASALVALAVARVFQAGVQLGVERARLSVQQVAVGEALESVQEQLAEHSDRLEKVLSTLDTHHEDIQQLYSDTGIRRGRL